MEINYTKILKWVSAALILILIVFLIFRTPTPKYFNKIELSNTNKVVNRTTMNFIDTILLSGLDELKYKGIIVLVRPMVKIKNEPDLEILAYIKEDITNTNMFLIEMVNHTKDKSIETISHELVHLLQLKSGKLVNTSKYIIWKSDTIYNVPEYFDRPWEQEAIGMGKLLENRIKQKLYGK